MRYREYLGLWIIHELFIIYLLSFLIYDPQVFLFKCKPQSMCFNANILHLSRNSRYSFISLCVYETKIYIHHPSPLYWSSLLSLVFYPIGFI